jgi:hypothetical protein
VIFLFEIRICLEFLFAVVPTILHGRIVGWEDSVLDLEFHVIRVIREIRGYISLRLGGFA